MGCEGLARFYERVEKRDGVWKIADRRALYDICMFIFPARVVEIDNRVVQKFPRAYAALAYVLEKSGFPVTAVFPTRGSDLEKAIKADGQRRLNA